MTKRNFLRAYTPKSVDGVHPDHLAVEISNLAGFDRRFVDESRPRSRGQVLREGTWLFPSGFILELTSE